MKPWPPLVGTLTRSSRDAAYAPAAQLDEKLASPLLIARSDPIADASLPDMRARSRPGTAIAAMMPMMATTINSSMRVKPLELRIAISLVFLSFESTGTSLGGLKCSCPYEQQRQCHGSPVTRPSI